MNHDTIMAFGGTAHERVVWQETFAMPVEWLEDESWPEAAGAALVLEISSGPLAGKRRRLQHLARVGVTCIVTAATTATLSAQRTWLVDRSVTLVGVDPLLVMAGGQVETVSGLDAEGAGWLARLWPTWRFLAVDDAIGHVFSREILPVINEACDFLSRQLPAGDINQAVRMGLNYPRGPIEWADRFGWSAIYWGLRALEDMYGPRFRPHPWIRRQLGSSLLEREAE